MAKVRVIFAEVEGGDDAVRDVVAQFVGQLGGVAVPVAPIAPLSIAAPPAPPLPPRVELPAPAAAAKRGGRKSAPAAPEAESVSAPPASMAEAIRQALRKAPMSNGDVLRMLTEAGFDTDSKRVAQMLCHLRGKNQVFKDDEDYLWRLAE